MPIYKVDSLEDAFDIINAASQDADNQVKPWQAELKPGDYFYKMEYGIPIYGYVIDPVELCDEDEKEYISNLYSEPHMRHYRFARAFGRIG